MWDAVLFLRSAGSQLSRFLYPVYGAFPGDYSLLFPSLQPTTTKGHNGKAIFSIVPAAASQVRITLMVMCGNWFISKIYAVMRLRVVCMWRSFSGSQEAHTAVVNMAAHSRVCLWSEAAMTKTPGGRAAITWAGNEVFRWKLGKEWRVDCRRDMLSKRFLVFILQSTDSRDKAISSKTDFNARSQVCPCRNNPWQQDTSHKKYTHTLHITALIVLENLINITKCDDGFWFCMKPMETYVYPILITKIKSS